MGIEGHLKIDLHRQGAGIGQVVISSARPVRIAQLFIGRNVDETVQNVPLVFSVCAMAQSGAAVRACERAAGIGETVDTQNARDMIVMAESLREHVLRIMLDWPQFVSGPERPVDLKMVMKFPRRLQKVLFACHAAFATGARAQIDPAAIQARIADILRWLETEVFGEDIAVWQERQDFDALKEWAQNGETIAARLINSIIGKGWERAGDNDAGFLPAITDKDMLARLLRDGAGEFSARPLWNHAPCETSAFSRQAANPLVKSLRRSCGSGLLARMSAKLCELARLPRDILAQLEVNGGGAKPQTCNDGYGLAQIEAARGRLVHMVQLADAVVRNYAIVAPTEWNFHPRGPAARALARLEAGNEADLKMQAALLINAIDPCVGFEVRLH